MKFGNEKNLSYSCSSYAPIFWMACPPANADWINLSGAQNAPNIAEIHINDDHVKIELEIFVNDMVTFDRLIPDEFFAGTTIKRASLEERMRQFSNEDLQVFADNGRKASGESETDRTALSQGAALADSLGKINPYTRPAHSGTAKRQAGALCRADLSLQAQTSNH